MKKENCYQSISDLSRDTKSLFIDVIEKIEFYASKFHRRFQFLIFFTETWLIFQLKIQKNSQLLYAACMHKPVVQQEEPNICKFAVLERNLVSSQLHLGMEHLRLRLQDLS